jgi:hypothetical protein
VDVRINKQEAVMKRTLGAKELLTRAKNEAKKRNKRRIKRLDMRHSRKLVGAMGASPAESA